MTSKQIKNTRPATPYKTGNPSSVTTVSCTTHLCCSAPLTTVAQLLPNHQHIHLPHHALPIGGEEDVHLESSRADGVLKGCSGLIGLLTTFWDDPESLFGVVCCLLLQEKRPSRRTREKRTEQQRDRQSSNVGQRAAAHPCYLAVSVSLQPSTQCVPLVAGTWGQPNHPASRQRR